MRERLVYRGLLWERTRTMLFASAKDSSALMVIRCLVVGVDHATWRGTSQPLVDELVSYVVEGVQIARLMGLDPIDDIPWEIQLIADDQTRDIVLASYKEANRALVYKAEDPSV